MNTFKFRRQHRGGSERTINKDEHVRIKLAQATDSWVRYFYSTVSRMFAVAVAVAASRSRRERAYRARVTPPPPPSAGRLLLFDAACISPKGRKNFSELACIYIYIYVCWHALARLYTVLYAGVRGL